MDRPDQDFVPALGWRALTPFYDAVIRTLTRESVWRAELVNQIGPKPRERVLDVGCGTGTLAVLLKQAQPSAQIIGLDPDPEVLDRAAAKARKAGVEIEWRQGFARDAASLGMRFDKAVSSFVFHQVPLAEKETGISAMAASVRAGGEVFIADFARQRSRLMQRLFGIVGRVDGLANTKPNAEGALERIIGSIDADAAVPKRVVRTPLGEISLFRWRKPVER